MLYKLLILFNIFEKYLNFFQRILQKKGSKKDCSDLGQKVKETIKIKLRRKKGKNLALLSKNKEGGRKGN